MTNCSDCGNEIREGAKFCDACGARVEPETAEAQAPMAPDAPEGPELTLSLSEDEGAVDDAPIEDTAVPDSAGEPESEIDLMEPEGDGPVESTDVEAELPAEELPEEVPEEPPRAGYLVFPDNTEQPLSPSQWLIGRADLAKFLPDPGKANEISRGHLTVFQDGERYFVEDGTTMVQRKASTNKTWLVRGSTRILVTGTGRNELQDEDEIDVAELVKLQFVVK